MPMECQCPERGDLHFHDFINIVAFDKAGCVNALKGATFISTIKSHIRQPSKIVCVNALKGATFISTWKASYNT